MKFGSQGREQGVKIWRFLVVLLLGFSSGLPISLIMGTLQAWMTEAKVDLKAIGAFALVGYPYTFKFVWSPLMVRYSPSWFGLSRLGPRRSWMVLTQLLLIGAIGILSTLDPASNLRLIALLAVVIAFLSASQDIVIDGYRTELLEKSELGTGASLAIFGYRVAMIVSGACALILADHMAWKDVYLLMASLLFIGFLTALFAPEPNVPLVRPPSLKEAVVKPLREFFRRSGALEILLFVVLYKLGDVLALALQTNFLLSLGFAKSEIGYVAKGVGLTATIIGSLAGGPLLDRLGMRRGLVIFGFFQGISIISFALLAEVGYSLSWLTATIAFENFCSGLGNAAFIGFLMSLCNKQFSTTQYALLTSLGAVPRVFAASSTGFVAAYMGWTGFFCFCTLAAVPGLILLILRYDSWVKESSQEG